MEVTNELLNQTNRLRQQKLGSGKNQDIKKTGDFVEETNSSFTEKSSQNSTQNIDQLKLNENINANLAKNIIESDTALRRMQNDLTVKQQIIASMQDFAERINKQEVNTGKDLVLRIQQDSPALAQYLNENKHMQTLESLNANQSRSFLLEQSEKADKTLKSIYLEIDRLMQKRNVEIENMAALKLPQMGDSNNIGQLLAQIQKNGMNANQITAKQNIEQLLS